MIIRFVQYLITFLQRCGNSITGWHSPCHIADGRRIDTGEHVDVTVDGTSHVARMDIWNLWAL